jgi:hypothetical protein
MKFRTVPIALFIVVTCSFAAAQSARATAPSKQSVLRLLDAMGSLKTMSEVLDQTVAAQADYLAKMRPDIPAEVMAELVSDAKKQVKPQELLDLLVPIYQKHFSATEVRALLAFYATPAGRKLALETPKIATESMQVGQHWGEQVGERIGERIAQRAAEKGYTLGQTPKR